MPEIFETSCPNLIMVVMVEPVQDREQQNVHGLVFAIMLSFCVIGVVSASVSFCTGAELPLDRNSQTVHAQKQLLGVNSQTAHAQKQPR